ncbi:MAG: PilW family protein [Tepidisphaerales bacterium]
MPVPPTDRNVCPTGAMTDRNVCPTDRQECLSYRRSRRGFTLVELLISMLLVMLVSVGISQVFSLTRTTVATGQKSADITRDARSATAIMQQDGQRWATDAPLFLLRDSLEFVPDVTGQIRPGGLRRDTIAFPMRGQFHRATGDPGSFVNPETSGEAWVWYGHCNSLTNQPTNVIGRVATLLMDQATIPANTNYYQRINNAWLSPLRSDSFSTSIGGFSYILPSSRYDLAGTTLVQIKNDVDSYKQSLNVPPEDNWWVNNTGANWWGAGVPTSNSNLFFRSQCTERMVNTSNVWTYSQPAVPPTSDAYARTTPVFLRNAAEFIVEFAGNFATQDKDPASPTYGAVIDSKPDPDGTISFAVARDNGGNIIYPIQRRTQWFGMYRVQLTGRDWTAEPVGQWMFDHWNPQKAGRPYKTTENPYFERQVSGNQNVWIWVNEAPKMVRVLFKQDDPEGLIRDGPWTEFIMGPQ